eukprot:6584982-Heterocapsa_arctica.AAC.1
MLRRAPPAPTSSLQNFDRCDEETLQRWAMPSSSSRRTLCRALLHPRAAVRSAHGHKCGRAC